ncbi:MAG: hypothetical protein NVSMB52_14540 [Chloroflexota bacterium]
MRRISLMVPLGTILLGSAIAAAVAVPTRTVGAASYARTGIVGHVTRNVTTRTALTIDQAQRQVHAYTRQYRNPHLVIDEVMEFQQNFYAIVKDTSTGHGAFEVLVNKASGMVFPEYGPAMMWNTKYGMMRGGMMGNGAMGNGMMDSPQRSGPMIVSSASATYKAQQWLQQHQAGATLEKPDQFPGYYTFHFTRNGVIAGMLAVNGYSGRIWYHSWHGKFIQSKRGKG